ncbi:MAG TPA: DUF3105 domain-containing protein [Gaiellaceae bacterium]
MTRRAAGLLAVAILGVGAVGAVVIARANRSTSVAATMRAAGCTYRDVAPYPPKDAATRNDYHADFPTLAAKPHWSTFPPSGGGHYRLWAVWGFYRKAVNPAMVVHNEEHGGVILWWGPKVPKSTIAQLERFYDQQPVGVFGTPIAGLGAKIALTAWTADPAWKGDEGLAFIHHDYGMGHVAVCSHFDQKAFAAFRGAYRGKSPQGFPLAADKPGCGPETSCPVR